jgi:hypothetical protein
MPACGDLACESGHRFITNSSLPPFNRGRPQVCLSACLMASFLEARHLVRCMFSVSAMCFCGRPIEPQNLDGVHPLIIVHGFHAALIKLQLYQLISSTASKSPRCLFAA